MAGPHGVPPRRQWRVPSLSLRWGPKHALPGMPLCVGQTVRKSLPTRPKGLKPLQRPKTEAECFAPPGDWPSKLQVDVSEEKRRDGRLDKETAELSHALKI